MQRKWKLAKLNEEAAAFMGIKCLPLLMFNAAAVCTWFLQQKLSPACAPLGLQANRSAPLLVFHQADSNWHRNNNSCHASFT